MGYIYMTNRGLEGLRQISGPAAEAMVLTAAEREPIFRVVKRVYQFLDSWRVSHTDTPLLLSVDMKTAKAVNSYFCEMSDQEYKYFTMEDGEVLHYLY